MDFRLGKLITMAGLDAEDSPFNNTTRDHVPRFQKSFSKNGAFSGDISSNGQINNSINSEIHANMSDLVDNARPKPYLKSVGDPTMKADFVDENTEAQTKRDELYERILQETSNAFRNIGEQDVTMNITGDTTRTQDESIDDGRAAEDWRKAGLPTPEKSRIPRYGAGGNPRSGSDQDSSLERDEKKVINLKMKSSGGEIIRTLSPFDDEDGSFEISTARNEDGEESRSMTPGGRLTGRDNSYAMDSFEQSYLSERGEVVHLGDDLDYYPESPSPIKQDSDNEDF